jgi:hypothetical protein
MIFQKMRMIVVPIAIVVRMYFRPSQECVNCIINLAGRRTRQKLINHGTHGDQGCGSTTTMTISCDRSESFYVILKVMLLVSTSMPA